MFVAGSAKVVMPKQGIGKASKLISILQTIGFEVTIDAKADYLLAIDHNKLAYERFISQGGSPERAFLLRLEPPSVFPAQYRKSIEQKYGTIFTPGSTLQNFTEFIGWPYQIHSDPNSPSSTKNEIENFVAGSELDYTHWVNREILLTMIAANKVAPVLGQKYAIRRKFAKNLNSLDFHLYGPLWSESLMLKLRHRLAVAYFAVRQGTLPNLASIYGNLLSKFSLVIENSDSYVSEKLFDSIIHGCIPVYFGPNLNIVGIPGGLAINYNGAYEDLIKYLSYISDYEIQLKLKLITEFLDSDGFKKTWIESNVYNNIANVIKLKTMEI
jgi:hypothetical protein